MHIIKVFYSLTILLIMLFISAGCSPSFQQEYPEAYKKYQSLKPNKAMAVVVTYNSGYAWGYASDYDTIAKAKERAMLECKARQKAYKIEEPCEIYYVNDEKIIEE